MRTVILLRIGMVALFSLSGMCSVWSRTWTDIEGRKMEAEFVSTMTAKGKTIVVFRKTDGMRYQFELSRLSEEDQAFIKSGGASRESTAAREARTPPAAESKIGRVVKGKLVKPKGNRFNRHTLDPTRQIDYYAFYFSAHWCPPCRKFTPKLVDFYESNSGGRSNFEIIFVSSDRDEDAMHSYMEVAKMPWPAIDFDRRSRDIDKYSGSGIPCLVVVDGDGKVISDSYVGGKYVGPTKVMKDLKKLIN